MKKLTIFLLINLAFAGGLYSQNIVLKGSVNDEHTREPVPFASVSFTTAVFGKITDSAGNFSFHIQPIAKDTLVVTSVGYEKFKLPISLLNRDTVLAINLSRMRTEGVVVKTKINRGLFLWRKIMEKKHLYDRYNLPNFGYEAYNKLEIDIRNLNVEKLKKNPLLKPYAFIADQVDSTSEDRPFLPAYLVETLSDYAFQKDPKKYRETIKAALTKGFENESITKMLGVMNQNVNVYSNFIQVMDKKFISPFYENADAFYRFNVADTQVLNNQRVFHFVFAPKSAGLNAFTGDAWVTAGTFRILKVNMFLGGEANINYVERVSIFQEYEPVNDSIYFVSRDKFFADFNLIGKKSLSFIGRKTTSYKNIVINSDSLTKVFITQNKQELIATEVPPSAAKEENWANLRHDSLSANEKKIYETINRLDTMPQFAKLQSNLRFLGYGYKNIGNLEIGPWYNWFSVNRYEKQRIRFDLGTNYKFDRNVYLHGYTAYGFGDKRFKGKAEAYWVTRRTPAWTRLHLSYTSDIDNGISQLGSVSQDNIFTLAVLKPGALQRFLMVKDARFDVYQEWGKGFSTELFFANRQFLPLMNLPQIVGAKTNGYYHNFEVAMKFRFAYLEQFIAGDIFRSSMGTEYPVGEFVIAKNIPSIGNTPHNYTKLSAKITDNIKIAPYGDVSVKLHAGKVYGQTPYPFLEIHPGNNLYYFDPAAYNLMTRFEYLSDQYAGLNVEHHLGSGIFRFIPVTRKLKLRQFWNVKYLMGSLSDKNMLLGNTGSYFKTLNGTHYAEVGTGIDNILKVLRLDAVWRISPNPALNGAKPTSNFGIFGSFSLKF